MGPRSHERGNALGAGIYLEDSETLQWGRVLMNAETGKFSFGALQHQQLQWGRVLMNAETPEPWLVHLGITRFNGAAFS